MINKYSIYMMFALLLLLPSLASAHKASVFAYSDAGQVYAEGYFFDGKPCKGCAISVLADKNESPDMALFRGKTDNEGVFRFNDPIDTRPLIIKMDAGEGHMAVFTLGTEEEEAREGTLIPIKGDLLSETTGEPAEECTMDMEDEIEARLLERMDARQDEQVAALRAEIRRLQKASERPGLTEVLGGIGYIFGMAGVWMYLQARRRDKDQK